MADTLALFPELLSRLADSRTTGVLPSERIEGFISAGPMRAKRPITPDQIQPSSIDLRLGAVAYHVEASFLPNSNTTVLRKLDDLRRGESDLSSPALLETGKVYIVPLQEELSLPENYSAKANPKSTTGRLDVFTRLITAYGAPFEQVRTPYNAN